ncbi:putative adenylate kinase 7, mitochondrial [Silene latifolia]|uniref:putative adenylate kinase 7, mitochondrial n=1 Tax=Silene latifolia TaxID=37657 RepID=UPI003D77EC81
MAVLSRLSSAIATPSLRQFSHSLIRSHHVAAVSAASAQPQFDYDTVDSAGEKTSHPIPTASNSEGSRPCRGVQWVFIGNPDAKKHVYAEMMSRILHVPHISITTLLRQDLNPNSSLYKQMAEAVNCKKIVPETIIFGLLSKRLEDGYYRGETGFILDGIPRTRLQAEILDQFVDVDLVVNFKRCGDHFQAGRSTADSSASCETTKSGFSISNKTAEDVKPNVTTFYREQKKLLEEYYQNQEKLINFHVGDTPGETWKGLLAALHLPHTTSGHPSWRLAMGFRVP